MTKKKKIILAVSILLLVGIGVGVFFYIRKKGITLPGQAVDQAPVQAAATTIPASAPSAFDLANQAFLELLGRPINPDLSDPGTQWAIGIVQVDGVDILRSHIRHSAEYLQRQAV